MLSFRVCCAGLLYLFGDGGCVEGGGVDRARDGAEEPLCVLGWSIHMYDNFCMRNSLLRTTAAFATIDLPAFPSAVGSVTEGWERQQLCGGGANTGQSPGLKQPG